jgi:hypothetical protein
MTDGPLGSYSAIHLKSIALLGQVTKEDVSSVMFHADRRINRPAGVRPHFFNPAVQFNTTVMGEVLAAAFSMTVLIRNRPSGATS